MMRFHGPIIAAVTAGALAAPGLAQDGDLPEVHVGVLSYGTAQWEMQVIQDNALDEANGIELVLHDLGGEQAGDLALMSGEVDVILTDYIWVSIQRDEGNMLTLVPHSSAVGGVMVNPEAGIESVDGLEGATIGIAGGPVDKSWLILQAYWAKDHDSALTDVVEAQFAAPPLVNELLIGGDLDAALNFWHYNARSRAGGMTQIISVEDMLADLGITETAPLLGWAFKDETAEARPEAIAGFLDASFDAKQMLLEDDAVWETLRGRMRAEEDDVLFEALRDDYRLGIITSYDPAQTSAAEETFAIMAEFGGSDAVGDSTALAAGTFWEAYDR